MPPPAPPTFQPFPRLPLELQNLIWAYACYPTKRSDCEHTRAHAEAGTLKGLELDAGFMIPGYARDAGGTELIQNRPRLVHKLQAVVSNNSYFSGCYDGTLNAGFVLYRRNVLLKTCRAARGMVWQCWRGDVERTGRERAEKILNKREEHWMRQGTWDEDGKREILGILDMLVSGESFSYDP